MGAVTPRHIVVTGAAGFLGRAIVHAAIARGHQVTEIVRSPSTNAIVQDLAHAAACDTLAKQINEADAIIHAASEMSGDWSLHQRSSMPATVTACALAQRLNAHLVHISSIAIYDYEALLAGETLRETSALETNPQQRDGYVRAKLAQEDIIADKLPNAASVLRVGAIFGKSRVMNAHLGIGLGPLLLRLASGGQIPLAHVGMVAQVAVRAAESKAVGAVNVLDSDLPDRVRFISCLSESGWPKLVIPVPWQIFDTLGRLLSFWKSRPGLLHRKTLHARMKPIAYDNALMCAQFGPLEMPSFETLMTRAMRND